MGDFVTSLELSCHYEPPIIAARGMIGVCVCVCVCGGGVSIEPLTISVKWYNYTPSTHTALCSPAPHYTAHTELETHLNTGLAIRLIRFSRCM